MLVIRGLGSLYEVIVSSLIATIILGDSLYSISCKLLGLVWCKGFECFISGHSFKLCVASLDSLTIALKVPVNRTLFNYPTLWYKSYYCLGMC